VVADYKYSLRGLSTGSPDYRDKLSEVRISSLGVFVLFVFLSLLKVP
jgi:hypothetical protein